ncbi:MAG: hypothetical protein K0R62_3773 [Nonomuraea muscovyensis]|nr:hypothetical protein [Nonomuraea muscovyensis]
MNGTARSLVNGRNDRTAGSTVEPASWVSGIAAMALAQALMFSCLPRKSTNALACSTFLLLALTPSPTTTPAGIQTDAASSAPGTGNIDRSSGAEAALRKSGRTAETWIAMAALPVATMEVCCSNVVPFGLSLKKPRFCSSRYISMAWRQPDSAKLAWPASCLSSNVGSLA